MPGSSSVSAVKWDRMVSVAGVGVGGEEVRGGSIRVSHRPRSGSPRSALALVSVTGCGARTSLLSSSPPSPLPFPPLSPSPFSCSTPPPAAPPPLWLFIWESVQDLLALALLLVLPPSLSIIPHPPACSQTHLGARRIWEHRREWPEETILLRSLVRDLRSAELKFGVWRLALHLAVCLQEGHQTSLDWFFSSTK